MAPMSVVVNPVDRSVVWRLALPFKNIGIERKSSAKRHVRRRRLTVVSLPLDVSAQQAMAKTERGRGENSLADGGV